MWEKIIELAKEKKKIPAKDKWELPDVIQIISIVVLHMSKIMLHIYTTKMTIYQFAIGYMINNFLYINRLFREQAQKCLGFSFYTKTMKNIRYCLLKKNISVMALIMIYENSGKAIGKVV